MPTPPDESPDESPRRLDVVQQWFQSVITNPGGIDSGIDADEAQKLIRLGRDDLEKVILRSKNLSAAQRLGIYANAYYARLTECLRESFPVLCRTLGEDIFNDFAFEYLQSCPSRSYTLNRLGDNFPRFLESSRDQANVSASPDWPDFLVDLAQLEWSIEQVFDGPGIESEHTLQIEDLSAITPDSWQRVRLIPAVCLRLLSFRFPVNRYFSDARQIPPEEPLPPIPAAQPTYLALHRRDFVVRRFELSSVQHALLTAILEGQTLSQAVESAAAHSDLPDDQLTAQLHQWFTQWTTAQFFVRIQTL